MQERLAEARELRTGGRRGQGPGGEQHLAHNWPLGQPVIAKGLRGLVGEPDFEGLGEQVP